MSAIHQLSTKSTFLCPQPSIKSMFYFILPSKMQLTPTLYVFLAASARSVVGTALRNSNKSSVLSVSHSSALPNLKAFFIATSLGTYAWGLSAQSPCMITR